MKKFTVQDSGQRREFGTGAVRDVASGKPRPALISPYALLRLGAHMAKGAIKYQAYNWAHGIPNSEFWESCMRHAMAAAAGKTDEDHLSAMMFNLMGIIHNQEMAEMGKLPAKLNDWPFDWIGTIAPKENPGANRAR